MNIQTPHIVFLTPGFADSEVDSTTIPALQVYLLSLRKKLPLARLTVITFQFPFTEKKYDWHGIKVIPLNGENKRLKKLIVWRKAKKQLKLLQKQQNIDVLHSFWIGECSKIAQQFSEKNNIKHVVTVMGQDAVLKNRFAKNLVNSSAKIISLSKNHQEDLLQTHRLESRIIPWHLDTSSFPPIKQSTIDILGVGSLNSIKNYDDFIDVVSELIKLKTNIKISIIGDGHLREALEIKTKKLKLQDYITFEGELPRKKVLEKMAQSNILLHTSQYESFGFVFLEALYSGMHIVSRNVGLAHSGFYWSICRNKFEIIDTLKERLKHKRAKKTRIELYSSQLTLNAYLNLYDA